jgi:hypothetical protein
MLEYMGEGEARLTPFRERSLKWTIRQICMDGTNSRDTHHRFLNSTLNGPGAERLVRVTNKGCRWLRRIPPHGRFLAFPARDNNSKLAPPSQNAEG